jgi:hypothetical protein
MSDGLGADPEPAGLAALRRPGEDHNDAIPASCLSWRRAKSPSVIFGTITLRSVVAVSELRSSLAPETGYGDFGA